jgi:hypothetical protein
MTDPTEEILAPAVIERAMSVFESLRERNHYEIVQARKALTPHVFELIGTGQKDEQRLERFTFLLKRIRRLRSSFCIRLAGWFG